MKNLFLILAVMLLAMTSHGAGLTVSTFYGISSNQFLETPTNDNATLSGTTTARGVVNVTDGTLNTSLYPTGIVANAVQLQQWIVITNPLDNSLTIANTTFHSTPLTLLTNGDFSLGLGGYLTKQGNMTGIGLNNSGTGFQVINGAGGISRDNSLFASGPAFNGSFFNLGAGVAIGTNNIPAHGKLDVWGNGWFTGSVTANSFVGDGSALTGLNASSLASGTVPLSQLPASVVTNSLQPIFTNGGWFITNSIGWVFQGSNGLYVSSNTLAKTALIIDTNRVVTWKSNNVAWITINPIDGSVRLENSVGNHGLVYGNVAMFNTFSNALPDEPAQMGGDFSFLNSIEVGDEAQFDSGATFGDEVTMQQDLSVLGGISGDGFSITDLNADNFGSGTVPLGRLPSSVVTNNYAGTFSSSEVLADTLGGKAGDDIHMVGNIRLDPGSGSGSIVDKSGNTLIDANGNFTGALLILDADPTESDGPYTFDTSEADTLKIKTPLGGGLTIDSGSSTIHPVFPFSFAGDGGGLTGVIAASVADTNIVVSTNNWNWPGPTNSLDLAHGTLQRYRPANTTPLSITNFVNFPAGQVAPMVLWIENTNTSALNVKLPSPCEATNSLGGLTVSVNASNRLQILFQWSPLSTNALFSDQQLIK